MDDIAGVVWARDLFCCLACGKFIPENALRGWDYSIHHRILGDRSDMRLSNLILLCGSGATGCHGWAHCEDRRAAEELGYIVSRYGDTLTVPVFVKQRQLGRVGRFMLDDNAGVELAA